MNLAFLRWELAAAGFRLHCRDVRAAVDLCHRDGSLKREVAENPAKYIHEVGTALANEPRLGHIL